MITPGGIYVSVTLRSGDVTKADDTSAGDTPADYNLADENSVTSSANHGGDTEKEELGLIMARISNTDSTPNSRYLFSVHGDFHDQVTLDSSSAVHEEDILYKMEAMQVKYLTVLDDSDVESTALAAFINRLAVFDSSSLHEVVFVAETEERMLDIESQCQETFLQAMQDMNSKNGITVAPAKEEFAPLLIQPNDSVDATDVKLTISEHILSGFRKLAQMVLDSLISVKTEDEDIQPYGEAS